MCASLAGCEDVELYSKQSVIRATKGRAKALPLGSLRRKLNSKRKVVLLTTLLVEGAPCASAMLAVTYLSRDRKENGR